MHLPSRYRRWLDLIEQVRGDYFRAHGRMPSLFRPRRFTEKMQWRKLFELSKTFTIVSDKLAVRDFVASRVGDEFLIPLLWQGDDPASIPFDRLTPPYVLKSTHAAGQVCVVHSSEDVDPPAMIAAAGQWLAHCHGTAMCEPGYIAVPRRLMAEAMLFGPDGTPPIEYKLFVFGGRVRVILALVVASDRISREAAFYTPDWQKLGWRMTQVRSFAGDVAPPEQLAAMIRLSEKLAAGFSHLRVDLYDCCDNFRVGELTLYTWSGHEPYSPEGVDFALGGFWPVRVPWLTGAWAIAMKRHPVVPRVALGSR